MSKHDKAALFYSLGIKLAGFIILKKWVGKCISLLFLKACLRLCYIRGAAYACSYRTLFLKVKRRHPSPFFFPDFPHQLTSPMSSVLLMQLFACVCTKKRSQGSSLHYRDWRESQSKSERERGRGKEAISQLPFYQKLHTVQHLSRVYILIYRGSGWLHG